MTVNLSMFAGAGQQFFDDNGVVLKGGLIYSYAAGTTTPQATYTTSAGTIAHANPIVLDSTGRVPAGGEIWLTDAVSYKFVLKDSNSVTIATYDNITGNASGVTGQINAAVAGIYATLAASSGSSLIGYIQGGTNSVATTVQSKLREYISVKDYGAVGDGTTDDTAAIQSANTAAGLAKKTLFFPSGTYLCSSQLVPTCAWTFDGKSTDNNLPATYLIKKSTMTVPLVLISMSGFVGNGVSVVGQGGNTGDNIQITGNGVILNYTYSRGAGQDGIRIGLDAGGNANSFTLNTPKCYANGRHGIYIHDKTTGAANANAGTLIAPFTQNNGQDGLRFGNCYSNTVIGILAEQNTGYGVYFTQDSNKNFLYGGDSEANTAGDAYLEASVVLPSSGEGCNGLMGIALATITDLAKQTSRGWNTSFGGTKYVTNAVGTWTPSIRGSTTAGTNTYSIQTGKYHKQGTLVTAWFDVQLASNTVAMVGNSQIEGLPFLASSGNFGSATFFLAAYVTLPAGTTVLTGGPSSGSVINLYAYGSNTAITAVPVANLNLTATRLTGVFVYHTNA